MMQDTELNSSQAGFVVCSTAVRADPRYVKYYILLANFLVMTLLPFLLLIITNSLIYRTVWLTSRNRLSARRLRRNRKIATVLFLIVLMFILCNFSRVLINIFEVAINVILLLASSKNT